MLNKTYNGLFIRKKTYLNQFDVDSQKRYTFLLCKNIVIQKSLKDFLEYNYFGEGRMK